jgi:hypothetical protein
MKINFYCVLLVILAFQYQLMAQSGTKTQVIEADSSINCEYVTAMMASTFEELSLDNTIIIVSYSGKQDRKLTAEKRAQSAQKFLTEHYKNTSVARESKKVISTVAVGKVDQGRVEFYVDGSSIFTIYFKKNRGFYLAPCQ